MPSNEQKRIFGFFSVAFHFNQKYTDLHLLKVYHILLFSSPCFSSFSMLLDGLACPVLMHVVMYFQSSMTSHVGPTLPFQETFRLPVIHSSTVMRNSRQQKEREQPAADPEIRREDFFYYSLSVYSAKLSGCFLFKTFCFLNKTKTSANTFLSSVSCHFYFVLWIRIRMDPH